MRCKLTDLYTTTRHWYYHTLIHNNGYKNAYDHVVGKSYTETYYEFYFRMIDMLTTRISEYLGMPLDDNVCIDYLAIDENFEILKIRLWHDRFDQSGRWIGAHIPTFIFDFKTQELKNCQSHIAP